MTGRWDESGGVLAALKPLFKPDHVAIIGASSTPGKQGNTAVRHLQQAGFQGTISPVNPSGGEIEGLPCYPSIGEVPGAVDCALFVIPAGATQAAVEQCVAKGVKTAVIGSNGFAEIGTDAGRERQRRMLETARAGGMILLGPNTNGNYNATDHLSLGYSSAYGAPLKPGPISITGHSGALFPALMPRLEALGGGLSKYVPVGNEADLDILDILEYFVSDDATQVIGMIVEALGDGARLRALANRARDAGKPIVVLKLGRSAAGQAVALAHSSRLAGSARAYDALFAECGITQVPSIESLVGALVILAEGSLSTAQGDQSLICVTSSGGGGGIIADHAATRGIPLAGKDGEWTARTAALVESYDTGGLLRNPLDGGNLAGWHRLAEILDTLEQDGYCGPLAAFLHPLPNIQTDRNISSQLIARKKRVPAPMIGMAPGGLRPEVEAEYVEAGIALFQDIGTGFDSLACYYDLLRTRDEDRPPPPAADGTLTLPHGSGAVLSELDSAAVLREAGLPMVESSVVATREDAVSAANAMGYPLVLKALAPDVAHKNKLGFVVTGIADADALAGAFEAMEGRVSAQGFQRADVPFILQTMLPSRAELIVGVSREDPLGHFLVAGLGGIHTELFDEVVLMPIPLAPERIRHHVAASRVGKLLTALDASDGLMTQLVDALAALQRAVLNSGDRIESIDVNPLLVGDDALIAVDALVVLRDEVGR